MNKIISDIYDLIKDNCIGCYKVGSQTLEYINNPSDEDYIFVFEDLDAKKEAKKKINKQYDILDIMKTNKITISYKFKEDFINADYWGFNNCMQPIAGDENLPNMATSVLDNINLYKKRCVETIQDYKNISEESETFDFYGSKVWYYIYRILCIIKNNSYELTKEQIEIINIIHDNNESQELRKKRINDLIEEVMLWQI